MRSQAGICFLVLVMGGQIAMGQPPKDPKKFAITDIAAVDADFHAQGEYEGVINTTEGLMKLGLQVVAAGDGSFGGMMYWGGLPGAGWDGQFRKKLTGAHVEGDVELTVDDYLINIDGNQVLVWHGVDLVGKAEKTERVSPTMGATPPANAKVLFAGAPPEHLADAKLTKDQLLQIGTTTKFPVGDFHLHIEFRTPYMPYAKGQQRGNSGVYIQRRYEVQILDSFGLEGVKNECAALYRQRAPSFNMCLPPLSWQTYDIHFRAARWDDQGEKIENARITVLHNGVAVHDDQEIVTKTGAGRPEAPNKMPIHFQNHGNPVHFRNMWIVLKD